MNVKLLRYTKDPLQTIIDAYRRCHLSEDKSDTQCECLGESDEKLLKKCIKLGHHSPLEFVDFEFTDDVVHGGKSMVNGQTKMRI